MIVKISSNDYLKRFDNMAAEEKDGYLERVGEWLDRQAPMLLKRAVDEAAVFQNVIQVAAVWNDTECLAWTDGARLLTALNATADTWLPDMLYVKSAKRAIRQMVLVLSSMNNGNDTRGKAKEEPAEGTGKATQAVAPFPKGTADGGGTVGDHDREEKVKPFPVRPKHIDQYVHLLPKKTQERAATVRGLLRELDIAREKARCLSDAGGHPDKVAMWAKAATKIDDKVRAIYNELDAEWARLVSNGTVTVDEFGNAHVVETPPSAGQQQEQPHDEQPAEEAPAVEAPAEEVPAAEEEQPAEEQTPAAEEAPAEEETPDDGSQEPQPAKGRPGRPAMTDEEKKAAAERRAAAKAEKIAARKAEEDAKRLEYLKKWLRDTRTAVSDERRRQWEENCGELLALGGEVTDSIRKAAEHYGAALPEQKP